jgi:RNA polymerase sigma-70 factor (ECF subfamily)
VSAAEESIGWSQAGEIGEDRRAWAGAQTAARSLEEIAENLAPRLLRFTRGMLGNRPAAEEAAQAALLALVERWRRHGPPAVPAAFAFAVARRRAARERWRHRLLDPLGAWRERDEPRVEALATQRLEAVRALRELASLTSREREALLLVAVGELSTEAAARVLGISQSAFKMRVSRARQRLRARLEKSDERS